MKPSNPPFRRLRKKGTVYQPKRLAIDRTLSADLERVQSAWGYFKKVTQAHIALCKIVFITSKELKNLTREVKRLGTTMN